MSLRTVHIEQLISQLHLYTIIAARSEREFEKGHLPFAENVPLLDNIDRQKIGTTYKNRGRELAVHQGLELIGPKMYKLYDRYLELSNQTQKPLLFYCWRGGLRSGISSTLMQWSGRPVFRLEGGYKSYRKWVHSQFDRPFQFISISGNTGSGKTEILHLLKQHGLQVLDLEGIANHKGSAYGALGQPPQPSTESFENNLAWELYRLSENLPVFVESESRSIGNCFMPQGVWDKMEAASILRIGITLEQRIQRLIREYAHFDVELLKSRTEILRKKLGGQHANEAILALDQKDFKRWIEIVLVYYDKTYAHSQHKSNKRELGMFTFDWMNQQESLKNLLQLIQDWMDREWKSKL